MRKTIRGYKSRFALSKRKQYRIYTNQSNSNDDTEPGDGTKIVKSHNNANLARGIRKYKIPKEILQIITSYVADNKK